VARYSLEIKRSARKELDALNVVYIIDDANALVSIIRIAHRREVDRP